MHSSPPHHQADHPALVVQRVVHLLLLAALRGLGVVGAQKVKDERDRIAQRFHRFVSLAGHPKENNTQPKGYWAIRTGHSRLFGMKTGCVSTKSSKAESAVKKEKRQEGL